MPVNKFVWVSIFLLTCHLLITFISNTFYFYNLFCVLIISPIISWFISNAIYRRINSKKVSVNNRAVLITGCDTGFGNQLAIECDKLGFHVFAGVLHPDKNGAQDLQTVCSERLKVMRMDVTKYEEVVNVVNHIQSSGLQLWAVVNNAGISINAPIEWGHDINQLNQIFAINVFGAVRVAKLSLPLLKKSNGRVINVSSLTGRLTTAGISYYCMSKSSIRIFSYGLRKEMEKYIKVINIEPVLYRTPIADWNAIKQTMDNVWNETPEEVQSSYSQDFRTNFERKSIQLLKSGRKNTNEVIDVLITAITLKEPQNDYICGGAFAYFVLFPMSYLPQSLQDIAIKILTNTLFVTIFRKIFSKKP